MNGIKRVRHLQRIVDANLQRRWKAACDDIWSTMDPEHVRSVLAWQETPEVRADRAGRPHDTWPVRALRLRPPALVRACREILAWGLDLGAPLALPPAVAQVYIDDQDAWPRDCCVECWYLSPVRCVLLTPRSGKPVHWYYDTCPLCGGATVGYAFGEATTAEIRRLLTCPA